MTTLKTCFKCKKEKNRAEFYAHPTMADGLLGKCKECAKKDVREHRSINDSVREYDRARAKLPHRRKKNAAILKRWRASFPNRARAQQQLERAVKSGKVIPTECWVCGKEAEAHHPDYSRPLDVVWLCTRHHRLAHQAERS